jgi:hypothetical protein
MKGFLPGLSVRTVNPWPKSRHFSIHASFLCVEDVPSSLVDADRLNRFPRVPEQIEFLEPICSPFEESTKPYDSACGENG